ncbi:MULTISPECIES: acyl-CoA thioesterase [Bradyrhizobium]|uniref:acyl-CoA thioesterase n=1 Tax=Bradyrhizobium elkanii TaxID=29448 RepID=UPI0027149E6E|nr:thioesterase family protein [Bradyrhizobium elkanii]WLA51426.1 thioesterase family protein [Bradyrhizobium elkanii]WLB78299.1 thioesterase family protein [Bradyrhizobium elkanii]
MREEFWFHFPFRVRYSEVDAQAVVFNAHYLTYFDTAITEYFRALGYDYLGEVARTGIDFHTVKSVVEYKAPIRFDEDIEVCVRVARIGRSSINLALAIFAKDSDDLRATGEIIWVATDQKTHQSVAVTEDLRALIASREKALARG